MTFRSMFSRASLEHSVVMSHQQQKGVTVLILILATLLPACAGSSMNWKRAVDSEEDIVVRYRIYNARDHSGENLTFVEDESIATAWASLDDCQRVMRDVAQHWTFTKDTSSSLIKRTSPSSWLIYYFSESLWPMKDVDRVMLMTQINNKEQRSITFQFHAEPSRAEHRGVPRMQLFDLAYVFTDLGNGKVKVHEKGRSNPPYHVPLWLIHSAFPKIPRESMKILVDKLEDSNQRHPSRKTEQHD